MKPLLPLASLAAAVTFTACVHVYTRAPQSSGVNDSITRYVAAEDNGFSDLRGALQRSSTSSSYYAARETLPGSSNCVVYVYAARDDRWGGCTFDAGTLNDAAILYHRWLHNVRSALPDWKSADVRRLPQGDLAGTIFSDSSQVHGVFVDIFGDPQTGYRVNATFAKISVLRS